MAPQPTGTLDSEVQADGTLAFRLRFRAYGERQTVFLHERRDCNCRHGCGGGWSERTARIELHKIMTRVEAGVWRKPTRREAERSVTPAEIPLFDDYIEHWLTARFDGVLGEKPLRMNTRHDYRWRAGHLKRFFGRYRLDEIDGDLCLQFKAHKLREAQELREALQAGADLRDARNRRVVPLGAASLKKLLTMLAAVLGDAVEDKHLDANPASSRRLRIHVPKPKRTFLEIDELAYLQESARAQDDVGGPVGRATQGCHRGEVALLGVGGELESGSEEVAGERVGNGLANRVDVGACDRGGLSVVPQLQSVLLEEVGVAGGFAHGTTRGGLLIADALGCCRCDQRRAGGGGAETPELVVLKQPVGIWLGSHQPCLQVGESRADHRHR
jgi:Phage integrase SAM-like domain